MNSNRVDRDHVTFRTILKAMSRPGTVCRLPHVSDRDVCSMLAEMLNCLMDNEVSFFVIDDDGDAVLNAVFRQTGSCPATIEEADFVIACRGSSKGLLSGLKRGTLEYPDTGATVVYLVDDINIEGGGRFTLSGPGINGTIRPSFTGLDDAELVQLREVNNEFPLGIDALFLDRAGKITGIPRSTRIGEV